MSSLNRVQVMGRLTRDPELRKLPTGVSVCDLGLAIDEAYRDRKGETVEKVCFLDIEAWERQAEACSEHLAKGSPVLVEGRLQLDKWKTREGENRSRLRVRADRVHFLGHPPGGGNGREAPRRDGRTRGTSAGR